MDARPPMNVRPKRHKPTSPKSKEAAWLLWLFFGWAGAHRMYLGGFALGAIYGILTFFSCGLGSVFGYLDGIVCLLGTPRDQHGLPVVWSWKRGKLFVDPLEEGTYEPAESVGLLMFHGCLLFVLPYAVMSAGLTLFETSEVKDTLSTFTLLACVILLPLFLVQIVSALRKASAQVALLRAAGALTRRTRLDAIARSVAIITPRGALVLVTGLAFLTLSLAYKWASLGVIAVMALTAFYLITSATALVSGILVRRFSASLLGRGAAVHRRFEPGVARAGDAVRDVVDVKGVPVPPGFFLTMEGKLPPRLRTEARHVIPPKSREERVTMGVYLERTPRGTYDAPALHVTYTDLLGLTRAAVASLATARLRVLPALKPAEVVPPPASSTEEPDILTRPHRFPTEDLFRFREYVAGDDTRRIQWRMSMRAGTMIVKTPESRETSARRVIVALDTWTSPDWLDHTAVLDDALDSIVEAWLAIAQRLIEQGEKVTLLCVVRAEDGSFRRELIACSSANHAQWLDAGARAEWQAEVPIEAALASDLSGQDKTPGVAKESASFDNAIVVTMRLAPPMIPVVARETTWIAYDPDDALGPLPRSSYETWLDYDDTGRAATTGELVRRLLFLPYPIGAEENGIIARMNHLERRLEDRAHRLALRRLIVMSERRALDVLLARPDAVYRLEVKGGHQRLIGLKGVTSFGAPFVGAGGGAGAAAGAGAPGGQQPWGGAPGAQPPPGGSFR